jgi:hypothetical protein
MIGLIKSLGNYDIIFSSERSQAAGRLKKAESPAKKSGEWQN